MLMDELNLISFFMKEICLNSPICFGLSQDNTQLVLEFYTDTYRTIGAKVIINYKSGDIEILSTPVKTSPTTTVATSALPGISAYWQGCSVGTQGAQGPTQGAQGSIIGTLQGWQGPQNGWAGYSYSQPMRNITTLNLYEPNSLNKTIKILQEIIGLKDSTYYFKD